MPASQLRGFVIGLFSLVALLLVTGHQAHFANAQSSEKTLTKKAAPSVKPTIAVLYFDYSGNDEEMGFLRKGMAQMLVTDLSASEDLQVVERIDLEAVLKELKLGRSNKIDPSSRNRIGKLLGARYLVTGGYFQFRNSLRVDAKIIDVERGTTTSVGVHAAPSDFMKIETQLASKLHTALLRAHKIKRQTVTRPNRAQRAAKRAEKRAAKNSPKVAARTVARYGRALDALDHGNTKVAASELETVNREAPHFKPAADDLRVLLR